MCAMKYMYSLYCFLISIVLLYVGCTTPESSPVNPSGNEETYEEIYDPEFYSWIDTVTPDNSIDIKSLEFEDGTNLVEFLKTIDPDFLTKRGLGKITERSPSVQKKELISWMAVEAYTLTRRDKWVNLPLRTQPNGLAYKWGGKLVDEFSTPSKVTMKVYDTLTKTLVKKEVPNPCQEKMYGLDCSGMIGVMARAAGISGAPTWTGTQHDTSVWNKLFASSNLYKDLKATLYKHHPLNANDQGIDVKDLKIGDLVFKMKDDQIETIHVGMVLLNQQGKISIYNSKGDPRSSCASVMSDTTGPCIITLESGKAFGSGKPFGEDWHVVRFEEKEDYFTDPRDGEKYKIVKIGNQTWFAENLRYSGSVPNVPGGEAWFNAGQNGQPAWCYYDNNSSYHKTYGKLYNWYAVQSGNLAPKGWHIPSDAEWETLVNFLGGERIAGHKMKSKAGWYDIGNGDNSSGFNGLPGGGCFYNGNFYSITLSGYWWSSSENVTNGAWNRSLDNGDTRVGRGIIFKNDGFSVRCLRD